MIEIFRRRWVKIVLAIGFLVFVILFYLWLGASRRGGQQKADPFRIAGNLYYVGANDVTAFLLTGDEGHILIDGGYPGTPPLIVESITELGFDIRDVKILLNTHGHYDHAGGLAELQELSGAELWISRPDAPIVASGGVKDPTMIFLPVRILARLGIASYPEPRIDHVFEDGERIRLGSTELVARLTPGHTPGCTSWEIPLRSEERELTALALCSTMKPVMGKALQGDGAYPGIRDDYERTYERLHALEPDIFLTPHARLFGRWSKYQASLEAEDPVDPFIDPGGYQTLVDNAEQTYRTLIAGQD